MEKVLLFALLVSVISHQLSFADIWIERSESTYKLEVVSDQQIPTYSNQEIYLSFFMFGDGAGYFGSEWFSLEPSSPSITIEQVSPLLTHDVTYRLDPGSTLPETLCSIDISDSFGAVLYAKHPDSQYYSTIGSYLDGLGSFIHVKADGPYTIGPGQSVSLGATGHDIPCGAGRYGWNPGYDPLSADPVDGLEEWWLGELYLGEYIPSTVSYDYLTNQLGLSPGTYTLEVEIDCSVEYTLWGYDRTTITIVPEPGTVLLLGVGGLFLRRRK